jgi:hypothetical protein
MIFAGLARTRELGLRVPLRETGLPGQETGSCGDCRACACGVSQSGLRWFCRRSLEGQITPPFRRTAKVAFVIATLPSGVLALTALVLISAAMILSRGRPISEKGTPTPKTIEVPPSSLPLSMTPAPKDSVDTSPSAASVATAGDKIEPFLSVVKRYAHLPHTGSAPVDDFIRQMEPRVELATKEAVTRAATLVHSGDRATMLAVLGAAMAVGWLLVKAANPSAVANR